MLFGSPPFVYRLAGVLSPWLGVSACVLLLVGAYLGLFVVAADEVQGEVYRILYIHPQAAYIGMMAYVEGRSGPRLPHEAASMTITPARHAP